MQANCCVTHSGQFLVQWKGGWCGLAAIPAALGDGNGAGQGWLLPTRDKTAVASVSARPAPCGPAQCPAELSSGPSTVTATPNISQSLMNEYHIWGGGGRRQQVGCTAAAGSGSIARQAPPGWDQLTGPSLKHLMLTGLPCSGVPDNPRAALPAQQQLPAPSLMLKWPCSH